jgi:hypothetical protein
MRFIVTARRDETKPTVGHVDEKLFAAYMKFNEEIHKAGVLVAAEGMLPGAPGARVGVVGGKRRVIDGPFAESKELVGGFYLIDVASLEEAKAWALRVPTGCYRAARLRRRRAPGVVPAPLRRRDGRFGGA